MSRRNRVMPVLPDAVLFDLENRLRAPCFMGVPIGETMKSCLNTQLPVGPMASLKAGLSFIRLYVMGCREAQAFPPLERGRILLTWLADTARLNDLVSPVLNELDNYPCNVIAGMNSIQNRVPVGVGFCTFLQICQIDMAVWRREYAGCRVSWHQQISNWLSEHKLPFWLFPHLAYAVAVRSLYVAASFRFLERVQPSVILTDSEHGYAWAGLILAARQLHIPTLQMMHGAIYTAYSFTPLLSDVACCWGNEHREQMIAYGTQPERLVITGCQRLSRHNAFEGSVVRARLGLPQGLPVVMLATNPIFRDQWRKQVFAFRDAFGGCSDVFAVVRLHPSESRSRYQEEVDACRTIRFLESSEWSLEESLAACDVVVNHNSGVGNDALVMGRPVVMLDVLDEPMSNGQVLADRAGCPVATSAEDLLRVTRRIVVDAGYRAELRQKAEVYVQWFCCAFGRDAAQNVANEVINRCQT